MELMLARCPSPLKVSIILFSCCSVFHLVGVKRILDTFKLQGVQIQQLIDGRTGLAVHPVPHRVQAFCGPTELNWWNLYYLSDDLADFFPQNSLPAHTLSPYCLVGSPTRQNARQYLQVWKYCRIIVYWRSMSWMGAHGEMPISVTSATVTLMPLRELTHMC